MARYHVWAYEQLAAHVAALSDDELRRDVGVFFRSMHGTLNHLALVDRLWMARITGAPVHFRALDETLHGDRNELLHALIEGALAWVRYVDTLSEPELMATVDYRNMAGEPRSLSRANVLMHVFNHGTHHRGHASAALTRLGKEAPALDLLYFVLPSA